MERFTYRDEYNCDCSKKCLLNGINNYSDVYTGSAIDKLAEYENFMEENGFESLGDIKQQLKNMKYYEGRYKWQCKNSRINYEEFLNLQQENEQLKQQLAEKNKLLEKENKALEIACKKIEDLRFENADICDYEYNEIKTEIRIKLLLEEAEEALKKLNKE